MKKVILSQNFASLAESLASYFQSSLVEDLSIQKQWIFVPSHSLKQWLLIQMATKSPKKGLLGFQICTLEEGYRLFAPFMPTQLEMICLLDEMLTSTDFPELSLFLTHRKKGLQEIASFVWDCIWNDFTPEIAWQKRVLENLNIEKIRQTVPHENEVIHVVGFDLIPKILQEWIESHASCFVYMFSPCEVFWEDVCTSKEQTRLLAFWHRKNKSLKQLEDLKTYIGEPPPLLANLGKVGRDALKNWENWETEDAYLNAGTDTSLQALQKEILTFESTTLPQDGSLRIVQAGMTREEEVLFLCNEILSLGHTDILVLSPKIDEYHPWIELLFSQRNIPYRFSSVAIEKQSPFYQGMNLLMQLALQGLQPHLVFSLLQNRAFLRKWQAKSKQWEKWANELFSFSSSWKEAASHLLHRFFMVTSEEEEVFSLVDLPLFEEFIVFLEMLETDILSLKEEKKTVSNWAHFWGSMGAKYVSPDFSEDADSSYYSAWNRNLSACKKISHTTVHSFEIVKDFLLKPLFRAVHGNHLHAVSFASIETGAILPRKAIFVLGMEEDNFPRLNTRTFSSNEPSSADLDRYLLLEIIMQAKENLIFSYLHESSEDGRKVAPSFLLQELIAERNLTISSAFRAQKGVSFPKPFAFSYGEPSFKKNMDVSLADLTLFAKHPWKYYLQKTLQITLSSPSVSSVKKERGLSLKKALRSPVAPSQIFPGILQEAFVSDFQSKQTKRALQMQKWGGDVRSLLLLETKGPQENEFLPLTIDLGNGVGVKITGTVFGALQHGALHLGDAAIGPFLQNWPEILVALCVLKSSDVYCLKTGKIKKIGNPEKALREFLLYYLRCKDHLSPLIPDWAPLFLKKKTPFSESWLSNHPIRYPDEVHKWILPRLDWSLSQREWPFLETHFTELMSL